MNKPSRTGTVTVGQAVKLSGKSRSVVFRAIKNGQMSATKNDKGHHLIDRSELTRWIDANRTEQAPEQTSGLTTKPIEQPKINAVDAIVKAKDETISQQAERIDELKELLEREQGRGDRLEARLLSDQRSWFKRLFSS